MQILLNDLQNCLAVFFFFFFNSTTSTLLAVSLASSVQKNPSLSLNIQLIYLSIASESVSLHSFFPLGRCILEFPWDWYFLNMFPNRTFGLLRWLSGKESTCQCGRSKKEGLIPGMGKIPWSRKWQPSPVFLLGEFHGQRSPVGYSS